MKHKLSNSPFRRVPRIRFRRFVLTVLIVGLSSCGGIVDQPYRLVMPTLPPAWQTILGGAHWRIEWIDDAGTIQTADAPPDAHCAVTVTNDAASPVLAYPYWPSLHLQPGDMKPAGAIFPWDVRGDSIELSWRGGVDAVLWRALSRAGNAKREAASFNWKRWREAWNDGSFPAVAVRDPWLCDWESIAAKIAASGFDKRRVVVVNYPLLPLSGEVCKDIWYGSSPFDTGTSAAPGEPLLLPIRPHASVVFSTTGVIRYSAAGMLLFPGDP
ncbi:MAG: hypothetical protein LBT00_13050 [Spirochaetaceae bacterium]|jgi:hypothetical protein|nr:hypothetical protein [Spirochaetaceae bacterium]